VLQSSGDFHAASSPATGYDPCDATLWGAGDLWEFVTSVMPEHFSTLGMLSCCVNRVYGADDDIASGTVYRARDADRQHSPVPCVEWREMNNRRGSLAHRTIITSHRRRPSGEPSLRSASLGSPIFVESWHHGSPLNWVEFMGSWQSRRMDRTPKKTEE
jgi:hypothetical protein